jgi:hypothetical protein
MNSMLTISNRDEDSKTSSGGILFQVLEAGRVCYAA